MNYKELEAKYPRKTFGGIWIKRKWKPADRGNHADYYNDEDYYNDITDLGWQIYLEHQCDEWVIGTVQDAKVFYQDLAEAIKYMEEYKE